MDHKEGSSAVGEEELVYCRNSFTFTYRFFEGSTKAELGSRTRNNDSGTVW